MTTKLWMRLGAGLGVVLLGAGTGRPQTATSPMLGSQVTVSSPMDAVDPAAAAHMRHERERADEDDRMKKLAADADKLLAMAMALKAELGQQTRHETSATAYQKAAEIERLAHDVKDRLKN